MTAYGPLRARLAEEYMRSTGGMVVDPEGTYSPQSPPLIQSYLQFLTQRRIPRIIGNAIDWDREAVGSQMERWADYTPSPYASSRPHRGQLWPWKGDIVVLDGGLTNPNGTLGIYLEHHGHGPDAVWTIFTQGPDPAASIEMPVRSMAPLGWWRVKDARIAAWATTAEKAAQ